MDNFDYINSQCKELLDEAVFSSWKSEEIREINRGLEQLIKKQPIEVLNPNLKEKFLKLQEALDPIKFGIEKKNNSIFVIIVKEAVTKKINDLSKRILYQELIDTYLVHLSSGEKKEIDEIIKGLGQILNHQPIEFLSQNLKEKLVSIREIFDEPGLYVENGKDHADFKNLVMERIKSKIDHLSKLVLPSNKRFLEEELEFRKEEKNHAKKKQTLLKSKQAPKPGSENHVVTEEEEFQKNMERITANGIVNDEDFAFYQKVLGTLFESLSVGEFNNLSSEKKEIALLYSKEIDEFLSFDIAIDEIFTLDPSELMKLLIHNETVLFLLEKGDTFSSLMQLNDDMFEMLSDLLDAFFDETSEKEKLILLLQKISLKELLELEPLSLKKIMENFKLTLHYLQKGLLFSTVVKLFNPQKKSIFNS